MNINKLFNKKLDIITKDNKSYQIENIEILIHDSSCLSGNANIIRKNNNIYLIKEVYSLNKSRLRYSYIKYENVKSYDTVEILDDGTEKPIFVIEKFDKKNTYIGSIGNIIRIHTDKENKSNDKLLILKLIKKNKKSEVEELIA